MCLITGQFSVDIYNVKMIQTDQQFCSYGYRKLGWVRAYGKISGKETKTFPNLKIIIYNEISKTIYDGHI